MLKKILGFAGKKVYDTIKNVKPFVPKNKKEKLARDYGIAQRKRKASEVKLNNTLFRINQEAKKLKEGRVYSGKELEQQKYFKDMNKGRENKMGGGMMGRRFGMKKGTPNPFKKETNVEKIKKTFAPKGLKKIDPEKQKGLAKLKKARPDVVRKMGYFKKGGRS